MSANIHHLLPRTAVHSHTLITAYVESDSAQGFLLNDLGGRSGIDAQLAVSCLLQPQVGDTVLVSQQAGNERYYILAVLERPDTTQGTLSLPGDNHIALGAGEMCLQSAALSLQASDKIELTSAAIDLNAVTSTVKVTTFQGWFGTVEAGAVSITLAAKTLSSKLGRLIQRAAESVRRVDGLDELRAGRSHIRIEGHQQTQAGHITSTAKGFVKIDGQKIDLG